VRSWGAGQTAVQIDSRGEVLSAQQIGWCRIDRLSWQGLSESGNLANPARGPHSDLRIHQELARANVSGEFRRPRSIVTQIFDPILRAATAKCAPHFSTVIVSTCIVLVLASRVPVTLTFFPMNFSGVFWSLSV
jgi:hypothetical protein